MSRAKLNKEQLIALCMERGLETEGLQKSQLIDLLRSHDRGEDQPAEQEGEAELIFSQNDSDESEDTSESGTVYELAKENEHDRALRLVEAKTELRRLELELIRARNGSDPMLDRHSEMNHGWGKLNLPKQTELEELPQFFQSFEKICRLQNIPENKWAQIIPGLFNASTRTSYNRLGYDICSDYKRMKTEMLNSARLNSKHYSQVFNAMHRTGKENYVQFLNRLIDVQQFYLESMEITTFEALRNDILMQRFKDSLHQDVRFFVDSKQPLTPRDAAKCADLFFECQKPPERKFGAGVQKKEIDQNQKMNAQAPSNQTSGSGKPMTPFSGNRNRWNGRDKPFKSSHYAAKDSRAGEATAAEKSRNNACYGCGSTSHQLKNCTMLENKTPHTNFVMQPSHVIPGVKYQQQFVIPTYVEGRLVEALRDSGSPITILRQDVLQGETPRYTGKRVALGGLFGNTRTVPTAIIKIHSPKFGLGSPRGFCRGGPCG